MARTLSRLKRIFFVGILATLPFWGARGATNGFVAPPDAFPLRHLDLLPAPSPVRIVPVNFPLAWRVARVLNLGTSGGRLWINARGWRQTNGAGGRIWVFNPRGNHLDPLSGRIDQHQAVDMEIRKDGIWLALDGGVAAVDPATFVLDTFAAPQGLTSGELLGFAQAGGRLFTLARSGVLYGLNSNGRGWTRTGDTSGHDLRRLSPWRMMTGSGDWLLVAGDDQLLGRHHAGSDFEELRSSQWRGLPSVTPVSWTAVAGDGDGGFWLGSNLGLHFVLPETGSMEHRIAPQAVTVPGGLQVTLPAGFQPSAAAYDAARTRMATGIRERMRTRARLVRLGVELKRTLDPVTPSTRLPGPVRALRADGPFLWVAAQAGTNAMRTDLMLFHLATRKWVARIIVPAVVSALAVDDEHLWIGCDLARNPQGPPLFMIDRRALVNTPSVRWMSDEIPAPELGTRLAALPVRERAVLAFFAGDAPKVSELLEGQADDAESLFLLAYARDALGLGADPQRDARLAQLQERFPESPFAEATRNLVVRPSPVAESPALAVAPDPGVPPLDRLFRRRDLDGNGKIDLKEYRDWRGSDAELKAFDADGDGVLNLEEFEAALRGAVEPKPEK